MPARPSVVDNINHHIARQAPTSGWSNNQVGKPTMPHLIIDRQDVSTSLRSLHSAFLQEGREPGGSLPCHVFTRCAAVPRCGLHARAGFAGSPAGLPRRADAR